MKYLLTLIGIVYLCLNVKGELQYYDSMCTDDLLTIVNGSSKISWGSVYPDLITLKRIDEDDNGYIEFQIESTEHIEVSLTREDNLTKKFGFVFKSANEALVQVDGTLITDIPTISYTYSDVFAVAKCDGQICYYKNDEIIYCHCLLSFSTALLHTTEVYSAVETRLKLEFECNYNCTIVPRPSLSTEVSGTNPDNFKDEVYSLDKNSFFLVNVYSTKGEAIKQLRIRTDNKGKIPTNHAIHKYLEGDYKVQFKRKIEN